MKQYSILACLACILSLAWAQIVQQSSSSFTSNGNGAPSFVQVSTNGGNGITRIINGNGRTRIIDGNGRTRIINGNGRTRIVNGGGFNNFGFGQPFGLGGFQQQGFFGQQQGFGGLGQQQGFGGFGQQQILGGPFGSQQSSFLGGNGRGQGRNGVNFVSTSSGIVNGRVLRPRVIVI